MKRSALAACLIFFAALAAPATAQTARDQVQDAIIAQLSGQGFTHIRVSNTFLGRVRIFATSPGFTREIIFNPRTGEILRDYWDDEDDFDDGLISPTGAAGTDGAGSGDKDDERADDGGDDGADDGGDDGGDDDAKDDAEDDEDGKGDEKEDDDTGDDE